MEGLVLRVYSDFFDVEDEEGSIWQCTVAGRLKKNARRTALVAAGDRVRFQPGMNRGGVIEWVHARASVLSRRRPDSDHPYEDIILANPDAMMVVFAIAEPDPHLRMLDRFLVAAEASDLYIFIVINKIDLTGEARAREVFGLYEEAGYPLFYTSTKTGAGIDLLRSQLSGQITVVAGPSGVGKSSLINCIEPGLNLHVGEVMQIGKGRHTTRAAQLHPLRKATLSQSSGLHGGYIADTPGLRELGLWDIRPQELSDYFREFRPFASACRFSFCTHLHEPGCAVAAAAAAGRIHPHRWDSYQRLYRGEE